ncbi:MAG: type 11 methyltransferase [Alphaproteobacteria bacterium]|nr:MAG: type 11 methyltransferase [Caulobacteraceae bacterium]TPW07939.1 MAG: type 11 methyltransferase [Alphaproteobacteria bacterium]
MVEGVVLELGFGSGRNVPFLDPKKISKLYALEPEEGMRVLSRKAAAAAPFPIEVRSEFAENLDLPDASIDTLFVTYTLCTIPDPVSALKATRRMLKPGGRVVFCEHGLAPDAAVQRTQRSVEPWWKAIAGGCHLTRDIPGVLKASGYAVDALEQMYLPNTPRFAGYNVWGTARLA